MDITHAADRARVRELAELFRRNFGWAVRSDEAVEAALGHPANVVLEWRERGRLMGAAVMRRNTVLMLCVDERARRALLAVEAARVVGVLIAGCDEAAAGVGGIACVAVVPERRGRGIARALVCAATGALRRAGMARGFIGYTYSGLEQLYGAAGYRISMHYFMARKPL